MSKVLAAVGGSGQEIALACLRLCYMAGVEPPQIYVFDSDAADANAAGPTAANQQTRTERLRELGNAVRAYRDGGAGLNPFCLETVVADNPGDGKLRTLFSPQGKTSQPVQEILNLLLTRTEKGALGQQETTVTDGFHGEPTVGSIAFADRIASAGLKGFLDKKTEPLGERRGIKELVVQGAATERHLIVVAGGTSGGTGPGVIPPLAEALLGLRESPKGGGTASLTEDQRKRVEISVVAQLPWFSLLQGGASGKVTADGEAAEPEAKDLTADEMLSNSASLVRYYYKQLRSLDRVVLLGLPDRAKATRSSQGGNHQLETQHYFNIVCGWLTGELLTPDSACLSAMRAKNEVYGFVLDDSHPDETPQVLDFEGALSGLTVTLDGGISVPLLRVLDLTRMLVAFSRGLRHQLQVTDVAWPRPVWRLATKVGTGNLAQFRTQLSAYEELDRGCLQWFAQCFTCDNSLFENVPPMMNPPMGYPIASAELGLLRTELKLVKQNQDTHLEERTTLDDFEPTFVAQMIDHFDLLDDVRGQNAQDKARSLHFALRKKLVSSLRAHKDDVV